MTMSQSSKVTSLAAQRARKGSAQALGETVEQLAQEFLPRGGVAARRLGPREGGPLAASGALSLNLRAVSDGISLAQTVRVALEHLSAGLSGLAGQAKASLERGLSRQDRLALNESFTAERRRLKAWAESVTLFGRKVLAGTGGGTAFQVGDGVGQAVTVKHLALNLETLGESRWQVLMGGPVRPEAPGARAGMDYVQSNGGRDDFELQGTLISLKGIRNLEGVVQTINEWAPRTGVTATRAEGNPLWLWSPKAEDVPPPAVARGSGISRALGLASYRVDPDFVLPLGSATVASWGDARHALVALRSALRALEALTQDARMTEERFEALVALAEEDAWLRPEKLHLVDVEASRPLAVYLQTNIERQPEKALAIQGNTAPGLVLNLLGAS